MFLIFIERCLAKVTAQPDGDRLKFVRLVISEHNHEPTNDYYK